MSVYVNYDELSRMKLLSRLFSRKPVPKKEEEIATLIEEFANGTRGRLIVFGAMFGAFVIALLIWQPLWLFHRTDFKTGNEVVSQIESYQETHGRLPETLVDVGYLDPNPRVFYQTTGKDQYCVWFETRMGEAETYYSRTKKWEDTDCGMDSFVFHK